MQYAEFQGLLLSDKETRTKHFRKLITNERNQTLQTNLAYFDGEHWLFDVDNKTNTTRSGKRIWGKKTNGSYLNDAYGRNNNTGNDVKFERGSIQTINYPKKFTHTYQDYILGVGDKLPQILINEQEAESVLGDTWGEIDVFIKQMTANMVISTVGINKINYYNDEYTVENKEASKIYPIYEGREKVGTIETYLISALAAKGYGVKVDKDKEVPFSIAYYKDLDDDKYYYVKYVDGLLVNKSGEPELLVDELQFDPYTITSNIDHPTRRFDDDSLEDSEIFEWIDKNDTLNSTRTIEFLTNLFLASPKVGLDFQAIKEMGLDLQNEGLQEAIKMFEWSPYTIDSTPFKVHSGNTIPDSFYKGLEMVRSGLFEDASIPDFLVSGQIPSGMATETIELGMKMLNTKLSQKRSQIIKNIKETTEKILAVRGMTDAEVEVVLPPLSGLTPKEEMVEMRENTTAGIFPPRYSSKEILKLMNRAEDVEEVKEINQNELTGITSEIQERRNLIRSEQQATQEVLKSEQEKAELKQVEQRINEIQ